MVQHGSIRRAARELQITPSAVSRHIRRLEEQEYRVTVRPRITSNNQFTIRQLTVLGLGFSFHVEPEVAEDLAAARQGAAGHRSPHLLPGRAASGPARPEVRGARAPEAERRPFW